MSDIFVCWNKCFDEGTQLLKVNHDSWSMSRVATRSLTSYGDRLWDSHYRLLKALKSKMVCVFPMLICSEIRMGQYRDYDNQEDALYITFT